MENRFFIIFLSDSKSCQIYFHQNSVHELDFPERKLVKLIKVYPNKDE